MNADGTSPPHEDDENAPHFTEVFLCALLSWQVVVVATMQDIANSAAWLAVLVSVPATAIYLTVRAVAHTSEWNRKRGFSAMAVLMLFVWIAAIAVQAMWESSIERTLLAVVAALVAVQVAAFCWKWPVRSPHPSRALRNAAAGIGIVTAIVAAGAGAYAWKTRSIREQALRQWDATGFTVRDFGERFPPHPGNDSLRQLLEDARPFLESSPKEYGKIKEIASAACRAAGDELSLAPQDAAWFEARSDELLALHRKIGSRGPPRVESDHRKFVTSSSKAWDVGWLGSLIASDGLYRLFRGDVGGAADALRAGRRLSTGLQLDSNYYCIQRAAKLEVVLSSIEARLPVGVVPADAGSTLCVAHLGASLQHEYLEFEQLLAEQDAEYPGFLGLGHIDPGPPFDSFVESIRLPAWMAYLHKSRAAARSILEVAINNSEAAAWFSQKSLRASVPAIKCFNYAEQHSAILCCEQAGILREVRKLGISVERKFPSAVVTGATWTVKPVGDTGHSVHISLTPALGWLKPNVGTYWTLLPVSGGEWKFAPARGTAR